MPLSAQRVAKGVPSEVESNGSSSASYIAFRGVLDCQTWPESPKNIFQVAAPPLVVFRPIINSFPADKNSPVNSHSAPLQSFAVRKL